MERTLSMRVALGQKQWSCLIYCPKSKKTHKSFFLDTDFHFKETYDLIEKVKQRYPHMKIKLAKSSLTPEKQENQFGAKLWLTNPDQCCQIRKLDVLEREMAPFDAWLSGLRREQSPTRANTEFINQDNRFKKK